MVNFLFASFLCCFITFLFMTTSVSPLSFSFPPIACHSCTKDVPSTKAKQDKKLEKMDLEKVHITPALLLCIVFLSGEKKEFLFANL